MKRVRPAPMGRAFQVRKRTAHLTVQVEERPAKAVGTTTGAATTTGKTRRARAVKSLEADQAKGTE